MKAFLSVTLFSGLLTLLRMTSGFVIGKFVAIYIGPSGIAMLGQVQSLFSALNGIVASPSGAAVVRYTSENQSISFTKCAPWWKAVMKWILILLVPISVLSFIFSRQLSFFIFGDIKYFWLILLTVFSLPLSVSNSLVGSVLNGLNQYRRFVIFGIASVFVATGFMLFMIIFANLEGGMIATTLFIAISGLVMILSSIHQPWFKSYYWFGKTNKLQMIGVGGYVAMAVTSAITMPIALIFVRKILINEVGWNQAGCWQAVYRISEAYLGIITVALSTYFLPKLAALKGADAILKEIRTISKFVMPLVLFLAIFVFLLRDVAISFVFTEDFRPARELFAIQLIGDVLKIYSWIYAYPMISRGATKFFILSEILFSLTFVLMAYFFIPHYGANGANIAYAFNYLLYLIFVFFNVKKFSR
jgi:PST family polysaccharide transporter